MHWYACDGLPAYEIKGANGDMRPTTLRDARKYKLVPSVTTIMGIQDKPQLLLWKQNQLKEAIINNGAHPHNEQAFEKWWRSCLRDSNQVAKKAAEVGSSIHDSIEDAIKTGNTSNRIAEEVFKFLDDNFKGFSWVAEDSFAHTKGFGGKVDLYGVKNKGREDEQRMVLDFKTKNKSKEGISKVEAYDDHHMQTAAYVVGIEDTKDLGSMFNYSLWGRYNLFIGYEMVDDKRVFTGLKLTESKDFEREWGMFEKLLEFWKLKNNYLLGDKT